MEENEIMVTKENYRQALVSLYGKLAQFLDGKFGRERIFEVAKVLGLENDGKNVLLTYETDIMYLYDYAFFEHSYNGKRLIELYSEEVEEQDETDKELIKACLESYISLFRVVNMLQEKKLVFLKDVLSSRKNERVISHEIIGLNNPDIVVFTRIVKFENFSAGSGMMCAFDINKEISLINGLVKSKKDFSEQDKEWSMFLYFYTMDRMLNTIGS
jgi:hypothetical protein